MRQQIAEVIRKIDPLDEEECHHKRFVSEWIDSGAELFRIHKPSTPKIHLVSYFIPIDEDQRKILLVHHKKANLWLPPGGHVDKDEHPQHTAAREMEEELYVQADFCMEEPLFLTATKTVNDSNPHTDVSLWYIVKGDSKTDYSYDEREFNEVKWVSMDDPLPEQVEPHLSRFLKKLSSLTLC